MKHIKLQYGEYVCSSINNVEPPEEKRITYHREKKKWSELLIKINLKKYSCNDIVERKPIIMKL